MRIALIVEYDGSRFHGWQAQPGIRTVQHTLEQAISAIANEPITVICAGRTDTGVHGLHQVVHFDTEKIRSSNSWVHGSNAHLPKDVAVRWAHETSDEFHARYSALSRQYRYIIHNTSVRPALMRSNMTWQYRLLNAELMHQAGQILCGEFDFTSFRSLECQSKTPMRNVHAISVSRIDDRVIIDIRANAFLHHMVRNIAGVLMAVGSGRRPPEWVQDVLLAKNRKMGAETASPYGLYLVNVVYPEADQIPTGLMNSWNTL
jgi:tRNA pseudouridine38-40 synthase